MQRALCYALLVPFLLLAPSVAIAQADIATITFEAIPEGTLFKNGGQPIGLEANTEVSGSLIATGEIAFQAGFRLPDGTSLASAPVSAGVGLTANAGLYSTTVVESTPSNPFTEVCLHGGEVLFDIYADGESTAGGNCLPDDTGWIIERFERNARGQCNLDGRAYRVSPRRNATSRAIRMAVHLRQSRSPRRQWQDRQLRMGVQRVSRHPPALDSSACRILDHGSSYLRGRVDRNRRTKHRPT